MIFWHILGYFMAYFGVLYGVLVYRTPPSPALFFPPSLIHYI
jgi:hypothetical protein